MPDPTYKVVTSWGEYPSPDRNQAEIHALELSVNNPGDLIKVVQVRETCMFLGGKIYP